LPEICDIELKWTDLMNGTARKSADKTEWVADSNDWSAGPKTAGVSENGGRAGKARGSKQGQISATILLDQRCFDALSFPRFDDQSLALHYMSIRDNLFRSKNNSRTVTLPHIPSASDADGRSPQCFGDPPGNR
jgi:hypothetical protein